MLVQGFLYAGGLAPVAETDGSGQIVSSFVYATKLNVPDYLVQSGTLYRVFTDHLGSVRLMIDASTGAIAQQLDYDPWGRITLDTDPGFQPFAFAGGLYDPQTGLTRFGARDYDPEIERWTSKDPIGFAGGSAGLYTYVGNDPVNAIDPSGLQADRYSGMMREWVENSALKEEHTRGAKDALIALGVMAFTYPVLEYTHVAASYWLVRPDVCTEAAVATAEVGAGVDGPTVSPIASGSRSLGQLARGRTSQARTLVRLGLEENTAPVKSVEGVSLPDALTDFLSIEIKDARRASLTRQLRIQTEAAMTSGRTSLLITGEFTCISSPCEDAFDEVIRLMDLGPPKPCGNSMARVELEALLSVALPFAKRMLQEIGEFHPFGAVLDSAGEPKLVGMDDAEDYPKARDLVGRLQASFVDLAKRGEIRAAAVCFSADVTLDAVRGREAAIVVRLAHGDGEVAQVLLPFEIGEGRQPTYGAIQSVAAEAFSLTS